MKFKEINAPSLNNLFVNQIKEMILSGELKIGEKLPPERNLADNMKINRSVVSSGIRELVDSGFLVVKPRQGTFVADYTKEGNIKTLISIIDYNKGKLDPTIMKSIYDIRAIHDCTAAELAAKNRTAEDIKILKEHILDLENADTVKEKAIYHYEFLHSLSVSSHNIVLPLIMCEFKDLYIILYMELYNKNLLNNRTEKLKEILNAVIKKDSAFAKSCAEDIVTSSIKILS